MPRARVLVIDEDLPPRLATSVRECGREAQTIAYLGLRGLTDPELLEALATVGLADWMLVTGNDGMPAEHADVIDRLRPTIATIDPRRPADLSEIHWRSDVVQRWAHAMQEQEIGTARRYSLYRSVPWTPRMRHRRFL